MKHALIAGLLAGAALAATGGPALAAGDHGPSPARGGEEIPTVVGAGLDSVQPGKALPQPVAWTKLTDETDTISISVPASWTAVDLTPSYDEDGTAQPWISATTDESLFFPAAGVPDTFSVPGVLYRALPLETDTASLLEEYSYDDVCSAEPVQTFDDGVYAGHIQSFSSCAGTASRIVEIAAKTPRGAFTSFVMVQLTGQPDDAATLDGVLASFDQIVDETKPATTAPDPSAVLAGDAAAVQQLIDDLGMPLTPEQEQCFRDNAFLFDPTVEDSMLDVLYTCVTAFFPSG
jgi:hypothetical protein